MKRFLFILLGWLTAGAAQPKSLRYIENKVRIYIEESVDVDQTSLVNGKTGIKTIDDLLSRKGKVKISQWLPEATEKDRDGDILLSQYYDIRFDDENVDMAAVRDELSNQAAIKFAEYVPDYRFHYTPNDPRYSSQWYLRTIQAPEAWDLWNIEGGNFPGDSTIVVGVVDSGCDWDHRDLVYSLWNNFGEDVDGDGKTIELVNGQWQLDSGDLNSVDDDGNGYVDDLIGWDVSGTTAGNDPDNNPMAPPDPGPTNGNPHGTHVAGIVAATTDNSLGMASVGFNIKHMPVKIQYDENPSDTTFDSGGSSGVLYAAKAGAHIINLSWGGGGSSNSERALYNNIRDNYGAIVVAAAGNEESEEESYPAAYSSVLSVASSNSSDTKSSFSNYGTWVDIIAPGSSILSAVYDDNYSSWSGTSMATPLVAGALGLVWSYYPDESAEKIKQMLLRGTDNIDDNNSSYLGKIGSGRLNVFRAIASGSLPQLKVASYSALPVNDDDGVLNPGEIALMRVVLVNEEGWADAKNITATLSSDHWAVTMIDSEAVFPDIGSGSSGVNVADRFQFQVDVDMVPNEIPFSMKVVAEGSGSNIYQDTKNFSVAVSLNQAGFPFTADNIIRTSPTIIDLDGDGTQEVLMGSDDHNLYVLDVDGNLKWSFEAGRNVRSTPAIGDIDGDGQLEVVFGSMDNTLYILGHDGVKEAEYSANGMIVSPPVLADLDRNGDLEIIFTIFEKYLYVINHDGTDYGSFPIPINESIFSAPAVGDVDGDNQFDIVIGTWSDHVYLFTADGSIPGGFPYSTGNKVSTDPALADLSGDGMLEIIIGSDDDKLHIIDWQGQALATYAVEGHIQSSPMVDDLDGDGTHEIIFGANDGKLYGVRYSENQLSEMSGWPVDLGGTTALKSSPVAFDLDNNGIAEVIVSLTEGMLFAINLDGTVAPNFPINLKGSVESSFTVGDLDGDSDPEIAAAASTQLAIIDVKTTGGIGTRWRMYRGGPLRTGMIFDPAMSIADVPDELPIKFSVSGNYPNPFNPATTVELSFPDERFVTAAVYDVTGREVKILASQWMNGGFHQLNWDGTDMHGHHVAAGIYLLSVRADNDQRIRKMTLLK